MMPFILNGAFLGVQDWVAELVGNIAQGMGTWQVEAYAKLGAGNNIMTNTWDIVGKVYDNLKGIGIALAVTVFILNIIDLASKDNATFENFVRQILNIIFTIAVINMGEYIVDTFIGINDNLVDNALFKVDQEGDNTENILAGISMGIVESLVAIVMLLIPALVGLIADIALLFPLVSRCMEVAWRCALMPIGVCNFTGGAQSPAMRYIKNLIAAILTGVFYALMLKIGAAMTVSLFTNLFTVPENASEVFGKIWVVLSGVFKIIVIKFATLGVMMSGTRAMKEVIS